MVKLLLPSQVTVTFSVQCFVPILKGIVEVFFKKSLLFLLKGTNIITSKFSYSRNISEYSLYLFIQKLCVV